MGDVLNIEYIGNFTGAGVMILEDDNKELVNIKNASDNTRVILFKDYSKNYSEVGGNYEKEHQNLETTGKLELREESRNLLNLDKISFENNSVDSSYTTYINKFGLRTFFYRCFFIQIDDIDKNIYLNNKKKIDKNNIDKNNDIGSCWLETTDLCKFYLKDIKNIIKNTGDNEKNYCCKDVNGISRGIRIRTIRVLEDAIRGNTKIKKIKLNKITNNDGFLAGTISLILNTVQ